MQKCTSMKCASNEASPDLHKNLLHYLVKWMNDVLQYMHDLSALTVIFGCFFSRKSR